MRPSRFVGALDAKRFQAAARQHPMMSEQALAAARAVLVDGEMLVDVAARVGVSKQRISEICGVLVDGSTPEGWESRVVSLPPELMEKVRRLEERARKRVAGEAR